MSKLKELPKPEDMKNERYFEIRDLDSQGCGSTHIFVVSGNTSEQEIGEIAALEHTSEMERQESFYIPSMFREPPTWRNSLKVVEQKRSIVTLDPNSELGERFMERTGKNYRSEWSTKRGGLKFKLSRSYMRIKTNRGTYENSGYRAVLPSLEPTEKK